jgi:hypothetical protein
MNMQFNEEPMGDPQAPMVEMKPWWQNPMFQELGQGIVQGAQAAGEGLRAIQAMRPEDAAVDEEEARRLLRIERARQSYERNFGMAHAGGQSMASQGQQESVDALLRRLEFAKKSRRN